MDEILDTGTRTAVDRAVGGLALYDYEAEENKSTLQEAWTKLNTALTDTDQLPDRYDRRERLYEIQDFAGTRRVRSIPSLRLALRGAVYGVERTNFDYTTESPYIGEGDYLFNDLKEACGFDYRKTDQKATGQALKKRLDKVLGRRTWFEDARHELSKASDSHKAELNQVQQRMEYADFVAGSISGVVGSLNSPEQEQAVAALLLGIAAGVAPPKTRDRYLHALIDIV